MGMRTVREGYALMAMGALISLLAAGLAERRPVLYIGGAVFVLGFVVWQVTARRQTRAQRGTSTLADDPPSRNP